MHTLPSPRAAALAARTLAALTLCAVHSQIQHQQADIAAIREFGDVGHLESDLAKTQAELERALQGR